MDLHAVIAQIPTYLIALFVAYVGYRQYQLGREKFKLDLFEKRFAVFQGTRVFLSRILQDGAVKEMGYLWEYRASIGEASFLFGDELVNYLEEIYTRAVNMQSARDTFQPLPVGEERTRLVGDAAQELKWLVHQLPELKVRFAPYLKFKKWH
jgi:hypothetical protein